MVSLWTWLHNTYPRVAPELVPLLSGEALSDVDLGRLSGILRRYRDDPPTATLLARTAVTTGGRGDLPGTRMAHHNLVYGQVRLGRVVPSVGGGIGATPDFGIDHDVLRTSLLVVGPPGSGKTRGFGLPIVEHLVLSSLAQQASVVVIDPKGDDFAYDGWFDYTVDPIRGGAGLDLFGGTVSPDVAADRLASALLPPNPSDDIAFFLDASRNALYACLAPFHLAYRRWPTVRELLALLRVEQAATDRLRSALKGPEYRDARRLLDSRAAQRDTRVDPAASMVERLGLLDRPALVRVLDEAEPKFHMSMVNRPVRVRIALPEAEFPDASRILARLVVSQFVQVCSAAESNRDIFKGLVMDEAGRFVDDYVARGVQRLRSRNAGLVLLTQTVSDFPVHVRATVFGSVGCKAVFGGVDPVDAEVFSAWFGTHLVPETTLSRRHSAGITEGTSQSSVTESVGRGLTVRRVERPRWSVSDLVTGLPAGHCVVMLSRSNGERSLPLLVNLRA